MTDTTTARRALLSLLLDRVEQDALLGAETPLLRPLVTAEQATAGPSPTQRIATYDDATNAVLPLLRDLDATKTTIARVQALHASILASIPNAIGGAHPGVVDISNRLGAALDDCPDVLLFCSPLVNAHCPGHTDGSQCERAASTPAVMTTPPNWEQQDAELDRRQALLDAAAWHDANPAAPIEEPQP